MRINYILGLLLIVAGAGNGFGRDVTLKVTEILHSTYAIHDLILTARDMQALELTQALLPAYTNTRLVKADFSDALTLPSILNTIFEQVQPDLYDKAILVCNAGSLGDITNYARDLDYLKFPAYMQLNVNSTLALTSAFHKKFHTEARISLLPTAPSNDASAAALPRKAVAVNISSLLALQPSPGFALYCRFIIILRIFYVGI